MLKLTKYIATLSCLLFAISSLAEDIKLLEVRNTDNGDRFNLVLEVNDHKEATGLKLYDLRKRFWKKYNLTSLPKGVPLRTESGYEVLILKSNDFDNDRGGHFKLNYLVSAISGARRDMPLEFEFDGTDWNVFFRGSSVERLDFTVKKFFGRNVGIASVRAY